jgi:hypothetical protein
MDFLNTMPFLLIAILTFKYVIRLVTLQVTFFCEEIFLESDLNSESVLTKMI